MDTYPHLTVATVVQRDNTFLMVHETTENGDAYNQPAGHLELGETIEQAAIRETLEETGWLVKLDHILGISHYRSEHNHTTYVRVTYSATPIKQNLDLPLDDGIIEAVWLTVAQLKSQNLRSPMVLNDIQRYLDGDRHSKSIYKSINI